MSAGIVLFADDEETFRESTCRLLQRDGFHCHCVRDADEAVERLRHDSYDVLVSDIRMPKNRDLQIVTEARKLDSFLSIILVTGYPSVETAIHGIDTGVEAYLTKPVNYDALLHHLRRAVERSNARRRISSVVERLHSVVADLQSEGSSRPSRYPMTADRSLTMVRTLASCLSDLLVLRENALADRGLTNLCELLDCPQRAAHRQAIVDAIEVLEKTKDNFKSKQLGELRIRLEHSIGIE
jgi:DNA-binding response OmpR family regulator